MKNNATQFGSVPFQVITSYEREENSFTGFSDGNGVFFLENSHSSHAQPADFADVMAARAYIALENFQPANSSAVSVAPVDTTLTVSVSVMALTLDTTAPTVVSFNPTDGGTRASVGTNITITFSESVMAGSGSIEIHEGSASGALVESFDVATSSHLTFSGSTLTIDPTLNLDYGTDYFVTIGSGTVLDLSSNSFAGTSTYDFMTLVSGASWSSVSGHGLLNIDYMLEVATGTSVSDAPLYGDGWGGWDWGLNKVQAPDAWQAGYTGEGIIVAVLDTGVQYTHSDLAGNIWMNTAEIAGNGIDDDSNGYVDDIYGYDFVNKDGYALDDNGHGTHVAGIIAGLRNGTGVTGVAYDATIMPVKVLASNGGGSLTNVAYGIYYAVNNGADVINMSLGAWGTTSSAVTTAITYAINHGVVVCMASGNNTKTTPAYPAILAQSIGGIAVGSVGSNNVVASTSNGAGTTVPYDYNVAPGVNIYSTYNNGGYVSMSGTSMATPYTAGAAALLLSAENDFASDWSLGQLESIITSTGQSIGGTLLTSAGTTTTTSLTAASIGDNPVEIDSGYHAHLDAEVMALDHEVHYDTVQLAGVADYEVFMV